MAKEIKQTALEVAETQLQNIAEEQKRLKQSIKVIKCAIRDREILCDRLQKDAKEAIECARSLREKDTTLQERLHSAQSRVIAARDTPYQIEELNSLNSISVEIAMNNQRYKDALRRQEETKNACCQVGEMQEEKITVLQDELHQATQHYEVMQKLYKEVFDDIGTHKMHMLRASIEEKEHNIKNCEKALEQARDQLTQEQDTIETVLAEWREKASFLRATHGGVSQPVTPEAEILLAALHLFETVRDKGSKAQAVIKISEMQNMRISELISLLPQDVVNFATLDNWRLIPSKNARGETEYILTCQRVHLIREALKHYS